MQGPSYLGNIFLVSIRFRMVLTELITQTYKNSFTLIAITNLKPMGRFFYPIINVNNRYHTFTYELLHHCLDWYA